MQKNNIAIFITAMLLGSTAVAQEKSDIEEVVVEGQYLSSNEVNSIKAPTPIIDVPQSLSIISAAQITEQGITSIGDIIDYTAGVNTSQGEGHRDAVVFRGVRSTADFYLDGNRDDVQYYRGLYNVEQIEILRGPNALLFGRGGTGGVLNRVSKKAKLDEAFTSYKASANSFGGFGVELDHNFSSGDSSAVRINAMYESLDNHRDFYDGDRIGFNPTARFELSEATTLDLSYEYADHERFIDRGIPTGTDGRPVEALEDVILADPELNLTKLEAHLFRAALQHNFSDSLKGNISAFYGDYDKLYQNFYATDYDQSTNIATLDGYVDTTERTNLILSANLVNEFATGNTEHTLIFGAEYIDTSSDQDRFNPVFSTSGNDKEDFFATRPISFLGGVGVTATGTPTSYTFSALNDDTRVDLSANSFYIQDQIAFSENFDVLVGARYDSFDIEVFNAKSSENRSRKDSEVSPRLGFIYKPQENISVYASYSESFLPRSGEQFANINGDNNRLEPDTFENSEVGIKWDFKSGLSLTAALFENEQNRPVVSDSDASRFDVIKSEVSGFELQLTGQLTDSWYMTTSYTSLDGETNSSGNVPREIPESMFSMWNKYQVSDKFGLGLGVTYQNESFINNSNSAVLPSYTRVDAAAYYDLSDKLRVQVNIENLTDELYFPNAHSTHQATVGAPIHALLTVTGKF
ncbi:TonB-dependent siderophore receptor PiuA [Arenicella sp. 4NH20-0111]